MQGVTPDTGAIDLNLFVLVNLVALTCIYLWAARRVSTSWPPGSTLAFIGSMTALALAYLWWPVHSLFCRRQSGSYF